jgi:hypothetical protein
MNSSISKEDTPNKEDEELAGLREYLRAAYLGAMRSNGDSSTDAPATAFSHYVMVRVGSLLHKRDKCRDQQIALDAQESLLKEIALDREYRAERMNHLISRNAIIKKLKTVRATLNQERNKD